MKRVYSSFYTMSRSEGAVVIAIALAVVIAYSAWGAYVLNTPAGPGTSPQVATTSK